MDEMAKRLMKTLEQVEAEEFATSGLTREAMDANRRALMDPSAFGAADDTDDFYTPVEAPDFEVDEEMTSQTEEIPGTDLAADHRYVRSVNYGLSKLYRDMIPMLVKQFANTENPRAMSTLNESVEQLRKIHKDMLDASRLAVETKVKAKPLQSLGDRFPEGGQTTTTSVEVDGKPVTVQTSSTRRLDMMAMLIKGFGGNMIDVPDEAFARLNSGEDPRAILEDYASRTIEGELQEDDNDAESS